MIVTRKWLQEYVDISTISTQTICKALNSIGLEVDSTQRVLIPNGVVLGKVLEKEKHPDADKLNVCQVDIGTKKEQIVCGAKNVQAGQYVAVATLGSVLGTGDNKLKIKKAKLRGVESNGMICSSTEIGLPKINDGIMQIDNSIGELIIGKELNEYSLLNDEIIEIELTANRGDCLSIHGVARELSTYFNIPLKNQEFTTVTNNIGIGQVFEVHYDTACKSNLIYKALNIKKYSLPLVQRIRTAIIDQLKQTDIETSMAYATHTSGVLLNVYTKAIANQDEDDKKVTLKIQEDENGLNTVTGQVLLSTIGIEAGHISKIDDEIIIEASYTDPNKLAQIVFDKKIKTGDIYYRASRGSEPDLNFGINTVITLLSQNGANVYNGSKDFINDIEEKIININIEKLNSIIGQEVSSSKITKILTSLGFMVKLDSHDIITVTVPNFRHDISNIADITEEIVRILGIDQIKSKPLYMRELNNINKCSNDLLVKNSIRSKSIANGFYETITYVFTNKELLNRYKFDTVIDKKDILNPIVNELNTLRTTIALNLVQAVSSNVKQGFKSIGLFEIGTIFDKNRNESKSIEFIFSGDKEEESVANAGKPEKIDFFSFADKISSVVGDFELEPFETIQNNFIHPYQNGNIVKDGQIIGSIYKIHPTVAKDFDINDDTFLAQINFDKLSYDLKIAKDISKFQVSKRDLSVIAPKTMQYKQIKQVINNLKIDQIKQYNLVDLYTDEKLGDNESITIKFILQSDIKTMQEQDINSIMDKILEALKQELNIGLR
jgi:phenylalanyl-tRNA synthetase beta chain